MFPYTTKSDVTKDLNSICGVLKGIASDGIINEEEAKLLDYWQAGFEKKYFIKPYGDLSESILHILKDGHVSLDEIEILLSFCESFFLENQDSFWRPERRMVQELDGVLSGIAADGILNDKEIQFLSVFFNEESTLKTQWPYSLIYDKIQIIIEDGVLEDEEYKAIKNIISNIEAIPGAFSQNESSTVLEEEDLDVQTNRNSFCVTGSSCLMPRKKIESLITKNGGQLANVSSKLNYLVVCGLRNPKWAFGGYGLKILKAVSLKQKGHSIGIISEIKLFNILQNQ